MDNTVVPKTQFQVNEPYLTNRWKCGCAEWGVRAWQTL
ncbi:hypothetical protein EDC90_101159 [Martelella mediterranea]|uniref:Uncharacterized protein n=1 Tax=Martelella mediterranea TaxID=293089 RepID=A0A4R3NUB1_9HYPH|nr:hypothetical protein EDC90_101159 [Martelella mediterranea]